MSDATHTEIDVEELRALVDDLDEAAAALREYGDEHDVPAIERGAKRVEGSICAIRQNVPGALGERKD